MASIGVHPSVDVEEAAEATVATTVQPDEWNSAVGMDDSNGSSGLSAVGTLDES